jgi:hypothetical protein
MYEKMKNQISPIFMLTPTKIFMAHEPLLNFTLFDYEITYGNFFFQSLLNITKCCGESYFLEKYHLIHFSVQYRVAFFMNTNFRR